MIGKDTATVQAAAALLPSFVHSVQPEDGDKAITRAVDLAEKLVDELQKRGYVAYDGDDGVEHHFIVPPPANV